MNTDVINPGVARPNLDHGRLLTLERRREFSKLSATAVSCFGIGFTIENANLLSPRRIYRAYLAQQGPNVGQTKMSRNSIASFSANVADAVYSLLRDYRDEGYPKPVQGFTVRQGLWTITLKGEDQ